MNGADMIDVCMSTHNLLQREVVRGKFRENQFRFIARIDDNGLAALFIAEDCAIALKISNREGFDDHFTLSACNTLRTPRVAPWRSRKSTLPTSCWSPGASF